MIDKLSAAHGVDKGFWQDFEKSVLTELRDTIEEVDPIDWLLSLANSDTGYGAKPGGAAPPRNNNNISTNRPSTLRNTTAAASNWDSLDSVLDTLNEINKM